MAKLTESITKTIQSIFTTAKDSKNFTCDSSATCPGCGNKSFLNGGSFVSIGLSDFPLKISILFVKVTFGVTVSLEYCPKCGRLSMKFS